MKSKHLLLLMLLAVFAPWAANAQESIPYNEGFESMSSTSDLTDAGWISYNSQSGSVLTIETSTSNVHSGSKALNMDSWDASTSAAILIAGLPVVDAAINTLQITFSYKVSTGTVNVGYLTDVNDASTFMSLAAFNSSSSYSTKTVMLNEAPASAARIAIKYTNYYRCYVDDITVETIPTCFAPQNLTCTEYTATSATLTWQRHASGTENAWVLQYSTDNTFASGVQSFNVSNTPSKELTGLTAETKYYARVRPDCDENLWSDVCEFKPSAAVCDQIGTGTSTAYLVYTSYGCTYSQHIYSADELTDMGFSAGDIVSVSFYYSGTSSTYQKTQSIYMGTTTKSSYSGSSASDFESDVTLVYGPTLLSYVAGWREYELTEPFEWDGNSNIVVGMLTNSTQTSSSGWSAFGTSTSPDYRTIYRYRDSNPIDITDLASVSNGSYATTRPNINLCILSSNTPKPRNIQVSDITASQATVSWEAPATGTPTGYEYQIKVSGGEWPTSWTSAGNNLSVEPTGLSASTDYVVRVRAIYAEGESDPIETEFRTLDACAFPTNFTATTVTGVGTDANFSWVKGYDETAWNLQLATDADFTTGVVEFTEGFVVEGNNVTFHATTLTPEQTYYAHVKANCDGPTSVWSNVETFTPTNYVDYTYGANASTTNSYIPFYGSYANDSRTISQYIIPATELADLVGATVRSLTYYTSSTPNWGTATVKVYVKEVNRTTFASGSASEVEDWETMTQVYNGSLTVSGGQMTITFDDTYLYGGGNLMIGIKMDQTGTSASVNWTAVQGSSSYYNGIYGSYSSYWEEMSYSRIYNYPKTTINYQPTPYKYPVIDEANCTFETTSAHIAWTVTDATPTGYQYQYKSASATEWPTAWTSVTTAYADLSDLTPGSFYDFRVKALYDGGNESVVVDYSFVTECTAITAFPWKETFESYPANTSTAYDETYKFDHPCWVNEHLVDGTGSSGSMTLFQVCSALQNGNSTHKLQLPDMKAGTVTGLRLPEMTLASGTDYQFVLDINRNTDSKPTEGIRVFVSTNGELEGATELCFISRDYTVASAPYIPAEEASGWYTYELPLGIQGTCYIILRGESQYGSATYMDNLTVEEIPTCARPSELASSNVTNHSATIEWTAGDAEQTLWQIAYSKTNFDPNTANFDVTTVTTIDATAHPFTLDKILDPESTYYVYVRANCGTTAEPDFGPWSRKGISFTTQVATPAPSNFVASNPASAKVDLVWNAGGGDFESWELYYVASETAPEAPTATTQASVSDITTLPTTENPYVLDELTATTKYYAWVRAKHVWNNETTYSDWVALTGNYFETLDACPTPTNLVATNLTSVSADLSWVGSDDVTEGYTVEYGEEGTYSLNETVDFSGLTTAAYTSEGVLPEGWMRYNSNPGYMPHVSDKSAYSYIDEFGDDNNYLLMTQNKNSNQYLYAIMPQINDLGSFEFKYVYESISQGEFSVGYVTDNTDYSTYHVLQTPTKSASIATCTLTGDNIATINANNGYVTFCYQGTSTTYYSVGIDDIVYKGGTYTPGATQTVQSEGTSITIDGLTPDKTYTVKVKSNCTNGEWSNMASFTTLAEGNKVFTNATADGKWGTADNWVPAGAPALTDEVIIRANATIESTCVAEANNITFEGTPSPTLTIADCGQLVTNTAVTATVQKEINAHDATGGWNFIASPINSYYSATSTGLNLITDTYGANIPEGQSATYDLYSFLQNPALDENGVGNEWRNYRKSTFSLANGKGYLYASLNGTTLNFTGSIMAATASGAVSLTYAAESELTDMSYRGWNLVGNPFTFNAAVDMPYYTLDQNGTAIPTTTTQENVRPCTGIMVHVEETGKSITFSRPTEGSAPSNSNLNIAVAQANVRNNTIMDKAILSFNEGNELSKFYFGQSKANIYFPQDNKEFAIVSSEGQGEMPLNFKANENGSYTLSFTSEEVSFSYLHLVDNMTGNDVDLLQTPSYTFDALTTDYESRFKLVFATGNAADDSFAFYSNGNWIINNDGQATLQVIDVTGRILSSETVNGSVSTTINAAPGVYMLRLVNGDNVKVQKVVVR